MRRATAAARAEEGISSLLLALISSFGGFGRTGGFLEAEDDGFPGEPKIELEKGDDDDVLIVDDDDDNDLGRLEGD